MDLRKARALQYYIIKIQAVVRGFLARVCTQQMMKEFMWIQENISNQLNDLQCSSHNEMCCPDKSCNQLTNNSKSHKEILLLLRDKLNRLLEEEMFLNERIKATSVVVHCRTLHCGSGEYNIL